MASRGPHRLAVIGPAAEELMICRLFAGGSRIRTPGPDTDRRSLPADLLLTLPRPKQPVVFEVRELVFGQVADHRIALGFR
jgi:hypothetical protein